MFSFFEIKIDVLSRGASGIAIMNFFFKALFYLHRISVSGDAFKNELYISITPTDTILLAQNLSQTNINETANGNTSLFLHR